MEVLGFSKIEILKTEDFVLSKNFYDKLGYAGLNEHAEKQNRNEYDIPLILEFINSEDKVLELGCGYGRIMVELLSRGYNVYGLDISSELLETARLFLKEKNLQATLVESDMSKTGFEDDCFDKVFCVWSSFNHILTGKKQIDVFNEIYRILLPGGQALLEVIDASKKKPRATIENHGFGESGRLIRTKINGFRTVVYFHDKKTLINVCKKSLFKIWEVKFINIDRTRKIAIKSAIRILA